MRLVGFMFMAALLSQSDPQKAREMLTSWLLIRLIIFNVTMALSFVLAVALLILLAYYNTWYIGLAIILAVIVSIISGNLAIFL